MQQEVSQIVIELARQDTPDGFDAFYVLIHGKPMPMHAKRWIEDAYLAHKQGKHIVIEAFRGSTKTTTFATFLAFRVGQAPHKANLLLQVSGESASDWTASLGQIIEHNIAFNIVFPNVKPGGKWGEKGYDVIAADEAEWARLISDRKDSTFLGLGRTSKSVIGRHPTETLIVDDFDDETTTRSVREQEKTTTLLTGTVFPAANWCNWLIVIGTPWNEKDTIHQCLATGEFAHSRTPVTVEGTWPGTPIWPEFFDEAKIERERNLAGEMEFARMYLLDIEAAKGKILKKEWINYFPFEEIDEKWSEFMGVDYASTADAQLIHVKRDYTKGRDNAAIAMGKLTPQGSLIVTDGWFGKVSKQETLQKIIGFCSTRPYMRGVGVEAIGKSDEIDTDIGTALLMAQSYVPVLPIRSHGRRSKGQRFEEVLAVMCQQGRVLFSSKANRFLKKLENEWISYDGTDVGEDDCLDALYMLWIAAVQFAGIALPNMQQEMGMSPLFEQKKKSKNPWGALAKV